MLHCVAHTLEVVAWPQLLNSVLTVGALRFKSWVLRLVLSAVLPLIEKFFESPGSQVESILADWLIKSLAECVH